MEMGPDVGRSKRAARIRHTRSSKMFNLRGIEIDALAAIGREYADRRSCCAVAGKIGVVNTRGWSRVSDADSTILCGKATSS